MLLGDIRHGLHHTLVSGEEAAGERGLNRKSRPGYTFCQRNRKKKYCSSANICTTVVLMIFFIKTQVVLHFEEVVGHSPDPYRKKQLPNSQQLAPLHLAEVLCGVPV